MTDFVLAADASPEIGMGHAVRMYALAEELVRQGMSVIYATRTPDYICARLAPPCALQACQYDDEWPDAHVRVLDVMGYGDPNETLTVAFDDYGDNSFGWAHAVVSPHLNTASHQYAAPALVGPQWLPLRREFSVRCSTRFPSDYGHRKRRVLVRADHAIGITPHQLRQMGLEPFAMQSFRDVASMRHADIAIVSASMTAYECFALSIPTLVYPQTEKHQPIADAMVEAGCALHWSQENLERLIGSHSLREQLGTTASDTVDGRGTARLATQLTRLFKANSKCCVTY